MLYKTHVMQTPCTLLSTGMEDAFRVVNTLKDAEKPISCIRFSPDGNRMAAASLDGSIYIYSVLENFKLEVRCETSFT